MDRAFGRPTAYTGKKQRIFWNPPLLCKNPHRKRLQIQVFARCAQMNSLRDRTGNQFDHNREFNSRQQRINSPEQGIQRKTDPLAPMRRLVDAVA
jgi:hypothetical protein